MARLQGGLAIGAETTAQLQQRVPTSETALRGNSLPSTKRTRYGKRGVYARVGEHQRRFCCLHEPFLVASGGRKD